MVQCHLFSDKIHALTRDVAGNVTKWDILRARKVSELGHVDWEDTVWPIHVLQYTSLVPAITIHDVDTS